MINIIYSVLGHAFKPIEFNTYYVCLRPISFC